MKFYLIAIALVVFASGPAATAAIIDNGFYTSDTNLGIDYLDVGLIHGSYAFFDAGVAYAGRTWYLATPAQLASTWSDATGLPLTVGHILSGDNDMGFGPTNTLINLFDGVTDDRGDAGERVIGDHRISWYYNFISGGTLAVHDLFDDSHYRAGTDGYRGAWLTSRAGVIPEPASILLIGTGLCFVGLAARRRR